MNYHKYIENNLIIHSTSNYDVKLTATQTKIIPIDDFVKENSKNPGTILTYNAEYEIFKPLKSVRTVKIETLLYTEKQKILKDLGIELEFDYTTYLVHRNNIINEIFKPVKLNKYYNSDKFINELKGGI